MFQLFRWKIWYKYCHSLFGLYLKCLIIETETFSFPILLLILFFYPCSGEWVACSVGANFTPHIITVNSGEVSVRNICYPLCSCDPLQNNISHIHGQGVAKVITELIYLTFFLVGNKTSTKNNHCICYFFFLLPPFKCFPCGQFFTFSLASFSLSLTYVACLLPYKVMIGWKMNH